jgi:hypothetical protein
MKIVQSDSQEVVKAVASAPAWASRYLPAFNYSVGLNALILLLALVVDLMVSKRAALQFLVPALLFWNLYVLWLKKSYRRNWCVAVCAKRIYVRPDVNSPEVILLESSEIASMSIRSVDVYLYGPEPKFAERLVIEPVEAVAERVSDSIPPFMEDCETSECSCVRGPSNVARVTSEDRYLLIGWKSCRPALPRFLQQVARECPSIVIRPDERSELDLNGIWHGTREAPSAEQRRMLVEAIRLGFGSNCARLLHLYRMMPLSEAGAYLSEIEQEETQRENSVVQR